MQIINGGLAADDRGTVRFVNDFDPSELGVRRFYQVENWRSGFVRAWHGHLKEGKYVYVPKGSVLVKYFKLVEVDQPDESCEIWSAHLNPKSSHKLYLIEDNTKLVAQSSGEKYFIIPEDCEITTQVLSDKSPKILWIPPGHANGFKCLEDDTTVMFFSTVTMEEAKGDDYRIPYMVDDTIWEEDFR